MSKIFRMLGLALGDEKAAHGLAGAAFDFLFYSKYSEVDGLNGQLYVVWFVGFRRLRGLTRFPPISGCSSQGR